MKRLAPEEQERQQRLKDYNRDLEKVKTDISKLELLEEAIADFRKKAERAPGDSEYDDRKDRMKELLFGLDEPVEGIVDLLKNRLDQAYAQRSRLERSILSEEKRDVRPT